MKEEWKWPLFSLLICRKNVQWLFWPSVAECSISKLLWEDYWCSWSKKLALMCSSCYSIFSGFKIWGAMPDIGPFWLALERLVLKMLLKGVKYIDEMCLNGIDQVCSKPLILRVRPPFLSVFFAAMWSLCVWPVTPLSLYTPPVPYRASLDWELECLEAGWRLLNGA